MSEDRIAGFLLDPFAEIARLAELDVNVIHERLRAMLAAGTIRRIRQTLMATNLAPGALVAWQMPADKLDAGFDFLFKRRSVFRPRRHSLDRRRDDRVGVPPLDDAEGAARLLDDEALRLSHARDRR